MNKTTDSQLFRQLPSAYQQMILEILGNFDFVKVANVMEFVKWEYRSGAVEEWELAENAIHLLISATWEMHTQRKIVYMASGGLKASAYPSPNSDSITLEFILMQHEADSIDHVS